MHLRESGMSRADEMGMTLATVKKDISASLGV